MNNKIYKRLLILPVLLSVIGYSFSITQNSFTTTTVFADSLPIIDYAPLVKRGWVGQYVYRLNYKGKGNMPAPFRYDVSYNRVHTGFVELSREINAAIRVNQADKNNATRWESWIAEGKKPSWNNVHDSIQQVTVITSDKCCRTPHNHQLIVTTGSNEAYTKGETYFADLQIDRQTGTWILSVPKTMFKADLWEQWKVVGKKLNNYIREKEENMKGKNMKLQDVGDDLQGMKTWDTITGIIKPGQREIILRRSIPLAYSHYLWHTDNGKEVLITPVAKGSMEFTLTLKRVGD